MTTKTSTFIKAWLRSRGRVSSRMFLVHDGERMPRRMGVAVVDYATLSALVLPVPLNVIVGALWRFWLMLKLGVMPSRHTRALNAAFQRGRKIGAMETQARLSDEHMRRLDSRCAESYSNGFNDAFASLSRRIK